MKAQLQVSYQQVICLENLFSAWQEFLPGKKNKKDVQEFSARLTDNILQLHEELANFSYIHGGYKAFNISDPKPRNIHKATVRDRVMHHAIYRKLYPFFYRAFIADSYSCQIGKGTHKAIARFQKFYLRASRNNRRTVWVLKCDIRKFFASIDHKILLEILASCIPDKNLLQLLEKVISSFHIIPNVAEAIYLRDCRVGQLEPCPPRNDTAQRGLPLGNLTSQLFCNVYMNKFDQFVKHRLKAKFYIRYADDFIFLSDKKELLLARVPEIVAFLGERLKLTLHPNKIFIKTSVSGIDFLGWINFPHYRVLRSVTKRRMFKGLRKRPKNETLQSYLGLMSHGDTFRLQQEVLNWYGLFSNSN